MDVLLDKNDYKDMSFKKENAGWASKYWYTDYCWRKENGMFLSVYVFTFFVKVKRGKLGLRGKPGLIKVCLSHW